jgi:hypothetical protein
VEAELEHLVHGQGEEVGGGVAGDLYADGVDEDGAEAAVPALIVWCTPPGVANSLASEPLGCFSAWDVSLVPAAGQFDG